MDMQTTLDKVATVTQLVPKNQNGVQGDGESRVDSGKPDSVSEVSTNQALREKLDKPVPEEDVSNPSFDEAAKNISEFVQVVQRNLAFSVEEDTGQKIIKVQDKETGELIRQIPSEEVVEFAKRVGNPKGFFVSTEA